MHKYTRNKCNMQKNKLDIALAMHMKFFLELFAFACIVVGITPGGLKTNKQSVFINR